MIRFFLILICCSVGAHSISTCLQAPVGKLPEGCTIGNLTVILVISGGEEIITNGSLCTDMTSATSLALAPEVHLWRYHNFLGSAQKYLLTAVDRTNNELLWMVSNVTAHSFPISVIQSVVEKQIDVFTKVRAGTRSEFILLLKDPYSRVIMPYRRPNSKSLQPATIDFLVFEEHRRDPSKSFSDNEMNASPFNLSTWIDAQQNSGISICGPVAGGTVIVDFRETTSTQDSFFSLAQHGDLDFDHKKFFYKNYGLLYDQYRIVTFSEDSITIAKVLIFFIVIILIVMINRCRFCSSKNDEPSSNLNIVPNRIVIPRN